MTTGYQRIQGVNISGDASLTYPLNGSVGSAAAPTYSFAAPHDGTGWYYDTVHSALAASVGGVQAAYLTASLANFTGQVKATQINLTGASQIQFGGTAILADDGASVYLNPTNGTTGSVYIFTGGAQRFQVDSTGNINFADASPIKSATRAQLSTPADGVWLLQNHAASGLTGVKLGGVTASFPYLKVSGTTLAVRLADDSADAPLTASSLAASTTLNVTGISTLGATNTGAFTGTTGSFSSTLGVTGITTLGTLNAVATTLTGALVGTSGSFSTTLGVTGISTLGATNTAAFTATTGSFSSTLGVTGTSTLGAVNAAATTVSTLSATGTVTLSNAAPTFNSTAATTSLQTYQNNGVTVATLDKGGQLIPSITDPSTMYFKYDWDWVGLGTAFTVGGNVVIAAVNSVSAPLMLNSTQGVGYCNTSSTVLGGYLCLPASYGLVKSASINYQWREIFYLPAASTSANRYTAYAGAFVGISAANTSNGPFAGPYIAYSDNLNSGNWVLGSAVNNTRTTANSSTAAVGNTWYTLQINLANGVYTYLIAPVGTTPLVSIGTVTDANIATTPANGQSACGGGIQIIPDGTNFTTQRTMMIDYSDYYVTGLAR